MKIFTLLQNLLKSLTGQTGRNFPFKSLMPKAQSLKPNDQRVMLNAQRVTPTQSVTLNAQRSTPNTAVDSSGSIPQMNESVLHPMAPVNDENISVEYKILPVQKKITSVQNIKPVFMQNFFAIVKKIFSLSDHPTTLLENLNEGYHPGCHYGTAGNENISRTNQLHDVANNAASFALIPIAITPTAMNQSEKKPKKTITGRSGMFGIIMLMSSLFFVSTAMAQTTTLFLQNTTTQAGTGTFVKDMALAQGSGGSVTSQGTTGTNVFAQELAFTINISTLTATPSGLSFNTSVVVNAVSSTNSSARFRLLHQDNTGTTVTNGATGYSGTFNSTGTKTATLTFPAAQTWASTDRLVLSIEQESTTGTSRTLAVTTGNAASIVQFCTTPTAFNVTGGGNLCSGGAGAPVGLDGSQTGVSYQLVLNGTTNVGSAVTGTGSAINFPVQTTAGTYTVNATTTVGGCTNGMTGSATVNVTPSPTITLSGNPAICSGTTSANLNYSATTNSPDQYSITWSGAAQTAGFVNVVSQPLPASPIVITVPGALVTGTYTGTLTVTNSGTTCTSTGTSISVIVGAGGGWLGVTSTDWFDASNWCGGVPTASTNVTIPAGTPFQPTIGAAGAVCNDMNISSGATLTITGTNSLTVSGNWTDAGTFVPGNSTVIFNSATTQTVNNGGAGDFFNATIGGAGTLQILTNQFMTTNSFNIAAGGTLDLNGVAAPTLGDLQGNGIITNSNATAVTITEGSDNTSTTYSGILQTSTGAISLTKTGTAALTLSGANTYTGNTTLTSGTLNLGNSSAIGASTLIINGGTIDNGSGGALTISTNNAITIGGSFTFGGTNNLNLGTGAITNAGSRTITLGGTTSILTLGGTMTNTSGGNQTTTVNGAGNTLVLGGYALSNSGTSRNGTFAGTGNVIISGIVSNGGTATASTLSYTGTGVLTLSGANTYGGTTTLSSGTLNINNATALGTGGFTINGGTIDNTSGSDLTLTTNNTITFGGSFTFGGTSNLNFGTGAITNAGSRTITLNGAGTILTFGGTMTNSSGTTQVTTVNGAGNNLVLGGYALSSSNTGRNGTFSGSGNVTISGPITNGGTGAGSLTYSGTGILTLNGSNTYTGGTTLNSGTLNINTATALGTGTFTIAGGTIDNTSGSAITLTNNNAQAWTGDFTFTGTNALNLGTGNVTIAAVHQVTISANTLTDGGNFSGAGGITKAGPGLLILTGNTNNTGATTITAGELRLNPAANSTSATPITLNGGILSTTNITATRTITGSGTLTLVANSNINLDPVNAHSITFANSSGVTWTPSTTLTVNNWQGTAGSSGTVGKIFFGSTIGTLTPSQLAQITFTGFPGVPIILVGTGEIVPQGAAPLLNISGTLNNGNACVGFPATTQTYTITNTASTDANGITVVSDNPEFVVSNLSGTTALANSASPLTFQVTFTPTATGAQTANITVASTTTGSNSPVAALTGNGLLNPVATFNYLQPSYCQAAITNPSPTTPNPLPQFTGGGVAGTFSAPAGLVFISTSTGQVDLRNSAVGTYTVMNNVTSGNGCTASASTTITINTLPTATIAYGAPAYCTTDGSTEPIIITNATPGIIGNFSSIPSGLTLSSSTGAITPSTSTPGAYKVVYNFIGGPNSCPNTDTAFVTIAQTAGGTISYPGSPYCTNSGIVNVTNNLTGTTTGALFSALPAGLTIDPNTGAVTTLTSTTGIPYTVTVMVPSIGSCSAYMTTATIAITDTPTATISYGGSNLCTNLGTSTPVITGPTGGTFASTTGLSISSSTGVITTGTSTPGTYTVTYTTPAVNGCTSHVKTTVTIQASTATPVLGTTTICTNTTSITITLTGEANGTPIQVVDNGVTVVTLARTTSTTYTIPGGTFHNGDVITITAQATGKCLSLPSNAVTVGIPPQPSAITGNSTVCPNTTGNAYSVTAVAGVTYAWTYSGLGATITNGTTAAPTIAFSGTATGGNLTVTASNTCGAGGTQTLPITVNSGPPGTPGSITGLASVCPGLSQTYSIAPVTNATNYTWTIPTGWTLNSGQGTVSINVTAGAVGQNGNITVVASNVCGNGPNPASNAVTTGTLNAGTGVDNTGNSGGTVAWTGPGNITAAGTPFATAATFGSVIPTSHYLIGSNYGFNIPSNASIQGITVLINRQASAAGLTDLVVSLVKATNVLVGNNMASATAWPITPLTVANYGSATNNWGANLTPADVNNIGFGVALSVTNPVAFTANTATVDVMQIQVTYALPQSLPVTVSSGPTITLGASPSVLCNGGTSASLAFTGTTGSPDLYSITYDPTAIGAGFANVTNASLGSSPISLVVPGTAAGGVYNATITPASSTGCVGSPVAFTITVPIALSTGTSETDAHCFGSSDGSATVTPLGGNGSYNVTWTGPNSFIGSGTTISGIPAGTYNYSITDGNGCGPLTGSIAVGQAAQITANPSETDLSCYQSGDGTASVSPANGIGSYTIIWNGPGVINASGLTISGLAAGTYNYSITDANGCGPITGSILVSQPAQIVAVAVVINACSDGNGGSVTVNVSGGSGGEVFLLPLNGGPALSANTPTSITPGPYQYDVIDGSCTQEVDFTVGQTDPIVVANDGSKTDELCNGGTSGSITLGTVTGGTIPYVYTWTTSDGTIPAGQQNNANLTGLTAGTYNYSVTDANGCPAATGSVTIMQPDAILVANNGSKTDELCNGGTNGSITLGTVTGGTLPYAYTWTTSDGTIPAGQQNNANLTGLTAGTYNYSVTDANNCTAATGSFTISQPDAILVANNGNKTDELCNGGTNGSITLGTVTGGTTPYAYTWTTGDGTIPAGQQNNANLTGLTAGTYNYSVTDANNCTAATGSFTISQPDAILVANNGSKTDELCNGGTNGSITLGTVTGGTTPYAYTWTTGDGTIPAGQQNNANLTGLTAGTYNYSVTDANNCTAATGSFTISQPDAILVANNGSKTDELCNGGTNGSITLGTVTGGTTPYAYTWTTGDGTIPAGQQNNANLTGLTAGTYHYSVTDANNCTAATGSFTISQPDAIIVANDGTKTNVSCNGGTNGSITLGTVTGGTLPYAYTWTTSDGTIPSGQQNNANLTGLTAGTYNYSVTDANNCTAATGSVVITQSAAITVGVDGSKTNVSCNGGNNGSITLGTVTGGSTPYAYTWTTGDGTIPAGQQNNANLTGLTAGTYNYSVTDASACAAATGSVTITQPDAILVANNGSKTDELCNGGTNGSITLGTVTGGTIPYAYTWTTGDGTIPAGQQNNANLTGLTAGIYNFSVTDANNCTAATGSFTISQPDAILVANNGSKTDELCNAGTNGSITLGTVTGGTTPYAYTWTTSDGTIPAGQQNNANLTGLTAGTYNFSVTDANNCTAATGSFTISQPDAIIVANNGSKTDELCNGGTNGSITLGTVTGGTLPYAYTWTTGDGTIPAGQQNNANLTGLTAGTYNYSVTDANNCTAATGSITIMQPSIIVVASNGSKTNVSCNPGNDGSITLGTVSGGTTPYAYTWTTSDGIIPAGQQNNANLTGLTAGTYNYSVTDVNNCTAATGSFTITQPNAISVANDGSKTDVLCHGGTNGSITLGTVSGGTIPYAYTWTTSDGTIPAGQQHNANLTGLTAGTYNYSVTDAHGCAAATGSVTINQPDILAATFTPTNITCFGASNGMVTVNVTGGTTAYQYNIDGNGPVGGTTNSSKTFMGLAPGGHTVVITDNNGCSTSVTFTLTQPTQLTAIASAGTVSCNSGTTSLFVIANGGTPGTQGYMYSLNGGTPQPGFVFTVGAGSYIVTVTDANNCSVNTVSVGVSNPSQMTIAISNVTPAGCTGPANGSFVVTASGGAGSYLYSLNSGGTQSSGTFSGLQPNTYLVTAKDANGCTVSGIVNIVQATPPSVFTVTGGGSTCNGQAFSVGLSNAQAGITYYLQLNGVTQLPGVTSLPGSPFSFGNMTAQGTYTVVAMDPSTGCQISMSGTATIVSGSQPIAYSVTGGGTYCSGGQGLHVGLQNSETGVNYQVFNGAAIASGLFPGSTGSQIDFGPFQAGTYTVVATNAGGCTNNMTGNATISLIPAPTTFNLFAPNGVNDCTGLGADIQLSGSESGVNYQLYLNGIAMGATVPGTGSGIDLGNKPSGTYTIVGTSNTGGCVGNMSNSITVISGPKPTAYTVTGGGNYCSGPGLDIVLTNSETGVNYTLMLNGSTNVGFAAGTTGNSITFSNQTANGSYSITATNATTNCTNLMSNNVSITAGTPPTVSVNSPSRCTGGAGVTITATPSPAGTYTYAWSVPAGASDPGNVASFSATVAGVYSVTITNATGCTGTGSGTLIVNPAPTVTVNSPSSCSGIPATIIATPVPAGSYTYVWTVPGGAVNPGNAASFSATVAGTYSVTITNDGGCSGTGSGALSLSTPPSVTVSTPARCSNGAASTITATPSPAGSYTYAWTVPAGVTNPGNVASFTSTIAGAYSVTITAIGGCTATGSSTLIVNTAPTVTVNSPSSCSGTAATIAATPSPAGSYTYVWTVPAGASNPGNVASFSATIAGTYSVTITNGSSCTGTGSGSLSLNTAPGVTVSTPARCSNGAASTITATPSPAGSYSYAWTVPAGASNPGNVASFTSTIAGAYSVTITATGGCTATGSSTLIVNTAPTVTVNSPTRNSGGPAATITATPTPAGSYSYVWTVPGGVSDPGSVASFSATVAGTYSVTITNGNGCSGSGSGILTVNNSAAPTVTVNSATRCANGPGATITATPSPAGTYTYTWTVPSGASNTGNVASFTATVAGTYTVTIKNASAQTATGSGILTVTPLVTITTQPSSKSICSGGSATFSVTANNATGYKWYLNNSNTAITGATNPTYTTGVAGNYKVVVSGNCGSTVTSSTATLSVNAGVTIVTQPVSTQICAGGTESFSVVATNATGYQWYRNSNLIIGATNAQYFTGTTGRYDCRVSDACGGSVMSDFAMLTINPPVAITSQPQSQTICSGGSAIFTVGASNTNGYQWYRNNNGIPNATHASYTATLAGNYKVVVTGGCGGPITSNTVSLSFFAPPSVAGINGTGTICTGTTVRFTDATSGGTWSSSNTSIATVSATGFVRGVSGGTATISYTISNGCTTNAATKSITVNAVPDVDAITGNSSVCPGSTIQLSDGTPGGDWSSSNTSIATVTNNGRVKGIKNGNVTISYEVQNSCGTTTASTPVAVGCSGIQKNSLGTTTNSDDELTLNVSVTPNPTQNYFTLIAQSSVLDAAITISIFDMQNRLVDKHTAGVGEAVRFGDRFAAGMYIVQVTQGGLQKTVKVVKN